MNDYIDDEVTRPTSFFLCIHWFTILSQFEPERQNLRVSRLSMHRARVRKCIETRKCIAQMRSAKLIFDSCLHPKAGPFRFATRVSDKRAHSRIYHRCTFSLSLSSDASRDASERFVTMQPSFAAEWRKSFLRLEDIVRILHRHSSFAENMGKRKHLARAFAICR